MSNPPEIVDEGDKVRGRSTSNSERPALTPLWEAVHGDGHGWASLDVADLDPPTTFPSR
jgi:hypothetical protein